MLYVILALEVLLVVEALGDLGVAMAGGAMAFLGALYIWATRHKFGENLIPLEREEMPWLYDGIAELAEKAKVPMPRVYLLDDYIPNAYSFGNTIVLSLGLFEVLDEDEIIAVAAHELGHIKNRDTKWFPMVTYGRCLMMITTLALLIAGSIPVKGAATVLYIAYELARSDFMKKREFLADETALRLLTIPMSLKRALEELKYYEDLRMNVKVNAVPSIEPGIEREKRFAFFTETHPSYEERILRITFEMNNLMRMKQVQ
ncbi:Zn-dependent protease with chaperone function [Thermococcus nautili]|uniref:M48 family metallopeptidase n=1 Tax=Thermococcus nautili TaxID=195522 RepID=UPI002552364C|nr:M48 family metalloprotease [Thermococcus nautili]CAI1492978.1 Zn-dependent protease with chaperone function [Thermococcus nautili]